MQCPACGRELVSRIVNELAVDVCEGGCGGVWFNWLEVTRSNGLLPSPAEQQLVVARDEQIVIDHSRRYRCPNCENIAMSRDFSSVLPDLLLNDCPSCGGFWLNGDEVDEIPHHAIPGPEEGGREPNESRAHRVIQAIHRLFPASCVGGECVASRQKPEQSEIARIGQGRL